MYHVITLITLVLPSHLLKFLFPPFAFYDKKEIPDMEKDKVKLFVCFLQLSNFHPSNSCFYAKPVAIQHLGFCCANIKRHE